MRKVSVCPSLALREFSLVLMMILSNACGKSSDTPAATPVAGTSDSVQTSAVADPEAKSLLLASASDNAIDALSDGGTGADGGGAGGADLVGLKDFGESRACEETKLTADLAMTGADGSSWNLSSGTTYLTLTRTFTGSMGKRTYATNLDGTDSKISEAWYPGPYFAMENITPAGATKEFGNVPVPASGNAIPTPTPIAGAATGSSGALGSVGWRSFDGSWNGAPVWEVGKGYKGTGVDVAGTINMVMYYRSNMPTVTAATTAPTVGGVYAVIDMVANTKKATDSKYSVLGQKAGGALPSFTSTGVTKVNGVATKIDQAGTVTAAGLPGKIYNPPKALSCVGGAARKDIAPGWRFSQNVAGLTRVASNTQTYTVERPKGMHSNTWKGTRKATWSDPALVTPYTDTPSAPYFDHNAGVVSLTRTVQVGSKDAPNTGTSVFTPTGASAGATLTNTTYSSVPFVETVTRDLQNGWQWLTKTVVKGEMTTTNAIGAAAPIASVVTNFVNIVWKYDADADKMCVPTSGTITHVITPTDATQKVTTITLKFGSTIGIASAPSGVTSTTSCSDGAQASATTPATNCTVVAEADDARYKPTGCNF